MATQVFETGIKMSLLALKNLNKIINLQTLIFLVFQNKSFNIILKNCLLLFSLEVLKVETKVEK